MKDYSTVEKIYANNFCSERLYKRKTCPHLTYTDGVMDLMEVFNAHWIVDNVILLYATSLKDLKTHRGYVLCGTNCSKAK